MKTISRMVLRDFAYALDGIHSIMLVAGALADFVPDHVPGLEEAGLIAKEGAAAAPENKDNGDAPELGAKTVTTQDLVLQPIDVSEPASTDDHQFAAIIIPEDWANLPWPELRALGALVSDSPVLSKGDATKAIQAELDRRAALVA